jgi:hypothetical protein
VAISTESLIEEKRNGFVTGLAVSELMLLILFVLLLFIVEGKVKSEEDRKLIDDIGGSIVVQSIVDKLSSSPEVQRMLTEEPEIIDLWISLTTSGAMSDEGSFATTSEKISELERELEVAEQQLEKEKKLVEDSRKSLAAANSALLDGVRKGGTTLCTYSTPTVEKPRPYSAPIGTVLLQNGGITLLEAGYGSESLIDVYGEAIDPAPAVAALQAWSVGAEISMKEFKIINSSLVTLGDEYANDSRQNCRYYFDYFYTDIDADFLENWNLLNFSGVKISMERFVSLL